MGQNENEGMCKTDFQEGIGCGEGSSSGKTGKLEAMFNLRKAKRVDIK